MGACESQVKKKSKSSQKRKPNNQAQPGIQINEGNLGLQRQYSHNSLNGPVNQPNNMAYPQAPPNYYNNQGTGSYLGVIINQSQRYGQPYAPPPNGYYGNSYYRQPQNISPAGSVWMKDSNGNSNTQTRTTHEAVVK